MCRGSSLKHQKHTAPIQIVMWPMGTSKGDEQVDQNYYILERTHGSKTPYLTITKGDRILAKSSPVPPGTTMTFEAKANVHDEPSMHDYHLISYPACSDSLKDAIDAANLPGIEWVPAVGVINKTEYTYWILRIHNNHNCVDLEESELEIDEKGRISDIEKLVLDHEKLEEIEEEKRDIFEINGSLIYAVSEKIATLLQNGGFSGMALIPVSEWTTVLSSDL